MSDELQRLDRVDTLDRDQQRYTTDAERLRSALKEAEEAVTAAGARVAEAEATFEANRAEERNTQRRLDELKAKHASAMRVLETGIGNAEAAERQRVSCAELLDQAETSMLETLEAQDAARAKVEAAKAELARVRAVLATANTELPPRITELSASAARVQAELEGALAELPSDLRTRYRGLREKGRWPVARVREGSCDACRMTVPSQSQLELKRGKLVSCHGCHRWLLLPAG